LEELLAILTGKHDGDVPADLLRKSLLRNTELLTALNRAWPLIDPADLVSDLWSVPAYLRMCAPWLSPGEVQRLQRAGRSGLDSVRPGRCRMRHGSGSATRRRPAASAGATPRSPPNASTWPRSSTT
jgi:hypothetical protein